LIVIQTPSAPLGWIAHDLLTQYSRYLSEQHQGPRSERPFPDRYQAQIVQPTKLPYAVRYVQRRDVGSDPRRRAVNYPFSSIQMYCGRKPKPGCFQIAPTMDALGSLGYRGLDSYFAFMRHKDSPVISQLLSQRIIGDPSFIVSVRERCRAPQRTSPASLPSPDEILQEVTSAVLHTAPSIAHSSTHLGALARALVAWYAMRTGAARISSVALWFGVTSSNLRYLIRRHRRINPQYFSKPLPDLFPAFTAATNPSALSGTSPRHLLAADCQRSPYPPTT
jgi:hypothetical protein